MQLNILNHLSLENLLPQHLPLISSLKSLQSLPISQETSPNQSSKTLQDSTKQDFIWSKEEDQYLLEKVQNKLKNNQKISWKSLSNQLNNQFHTGNDVRNRQKTRQRYYNFLDPSLKKSNWTEAEDLFIVLKKSQGLQWCKMKSYMQGRNDHQVKNRFYFLLKQFSKNDSYCARIFTSQLKVISFSDYISTYLRNEKNDKLKQIMKQCEKRKTQSNLENQLNSFQVEVPPQVQVYPHVVTQECRSIIVPYNSAYSYQTLNLQENQQKLPSFYSIMQSQGNIISNRVGYFQVESDQCNKIWWDRNKSQSNS